MRIKTDDIKAIKMASDGFPDTNVTQAVRSSAVYSAAWIQAAYRSRVGYWGLGWNDTYREKFHMMRLYAMGKQPERRYMERYALPQGDTSINGSGETNEYSLAADPGILAIMPQMLQKIEAKISKYPTVPQVVALDPRSKNERQAFRYGKLAEMRNRTVLPSMYAAVGQNYDAAALPENPEELDMYMDAGGYKPAYCLAMEAVVTSALEQCMYDERIKRDLVRLDLIPNGLGAVGVGLSGNGPVYAERIDPADLLLPFSEHRDFHDIPWVGRFRRMSDDRIIREAQGQLSAEEVKDLDKYRRKVGELGWPDQGYSWRQQVGRAEIAVLDFYFIAKREINYKSVPAQQGDKLYRISDDKLVDDSEAEYGRETICCQAVYGGSWVVGSDIYWNMGMMESQPAISPGRPDLPIRVIMPLNYGMEHVSLVESCCAPLDRLQLSYLRLQNIEEANGPNIIVYVKEMIEAVAAQDGIKADEVFKVLRQSGIIPVTYVNAALDAFQGNAQPVYSVPLNDQGIPIQNELTIFSHYLGLIQRTLGISDIMAGGPIEERKGKAIATMEMNSTIDSISGIVDSVTVLGKNVARTMLGFAISAMTGGSTVERRYWEGAIGTETVAAIRTLARDEFSNEDNALMLENMGVSVLPYPDPADVERIYARLAQGVMSVDGGQPLLSIEDEFIVSDYVSRGMINHAKYYLVAAGKRKKREQAKIAEQQAQYAKEQQAQMIDMNAKVKGMELQMQTQKDVTKIQAGDAGRMELAQFNAEVSMALQQARLEADAASKENMAALTAMLSEQLIAMELRMEARNKQDAIRLQGAEDRKTQAEAPAPRQGE